MRTQEITREEWNSFFNTFSQQHEGWLATLEIFGPEVGAQKEAHELSLEGISLGSGTGESPKITIEIGKTPDEHVSHTISNPTHVWLEKTEAGAHAALEIEDEDQGKALLRFRSPVLPEIVDGVVLEH